MTERSDCDFKVAEFPSGAPWIVVEIWSVMLSLNGVLGFDLPDGTTLEQAAEIAKYMQDHLPRIAFTPQR
jgi:hypothetical protein